MRPNCQVLAVDDRANSETCIEVIECIHLLVVILFMTFKSFERGQLREDALREWWEQRGRGERGW